MHVRAQSCHKRDQNCSLERKIFVGMISKKLAENDLRHMFNRFGLIEECSILRDPNGVSRGCGFVTFASKACALNAIKGMHQSTIMEVSSWAPVLWSLAVIMSLFKGLFSSAGCQDGRHSKRKNHEQPQYEHCTPSNRSKPCPKSAVSCRKCPSLQLEPHPEILQ